MNRSGALLDRHYLLTQVIKFDACVNWGQRQPDNAGSVEDFEMIFAGSSVPTGIIAGKWNDPPNYFNHGSN